MITQRSAYPSPANEAITIAMPDRAASDVNILLFDMLGNTSASGMLKKGEWKTSLSTKEMAEGLYIIKIGTGNLSNITRVVVLHK